MIVGLPSSGTRLIIPPNTEEFKVYGGCDSSCIGAVSGIEVLVEPQD